VSTIFNIQFQVFQEHHCICYWPVIAVDKTRYPCPQLAGRNRYCLFATLPCSQGAGLSRIRKWSHVLMFRLWNSTKKPPSFNSRCGSSAPRSVLQNCWWRPKNLMAWSRSTKCRARCANHWYQHGLAPPKKVCNKAGRLCAALKMKLLFREILESVEIVSRRSVTLKMRTGWSLDTKKRLTIAKWREDIGISKHSHSMEERSDEKNVNFTERRHWPVTGRTLTLFTNPDFPVFQRKERFILYKRAEPSGFYCILFWTSWK